MAFVQQERTVFMQKRELGRTGHLSSIVIMGTAALGAADQETANTALDLAAASGVNHIDVAPQYGVAEERVGPWLEQHRLQFFVGCKTLQREKSGAWSDLLRSLERLRCKMLDLYQLHAVNSFQELDRIFGHDGALETLIEARDRGMVRFLGITGHGLEAPAVQAEALRRFDFHTVMFPINPALYANPDYRRDAHVLLRMCEERGVGVIVIKPLARGPWGEKAHQYTTWYEPFDDPATIETWVRFALSQPVSCIASPGDVRLLPTILGAAERFTPLTEAEQEQAIKDAESLTPLFT
jgi:aryl-alcohol dehydrogenase-like predicted oxidoreductase